MRRLRKAGEGDAVIAKKLNEEGAATRSGRRWTSRAVFNVLKRWRVVEKFTQPADAIHKVKP